MRKIILTAFGAALITASMAGAASAADRHHARDRVVEQRCAYLEADGADAGARHVYRDDLAAYLRVLPAATTLPPAIGTVYDSTVWFPDRASQQIVATSVQFEETILPGSDPTQPGSCTTVFPVMTGIFFAARSATNPLTSFTQPFRMEVR